jgi:hypothetical protein
MYLTEPGTLREYHAYTGYLTEPGTVRDYHAYKVPYRTRDSEGLPRLQKYLTEPGTVREYHA